MPGDTPMGPRPDLRRMLVPIGPVAVFGSSNFPLAFSVPGGDTASALAAGSPVILKAHSSHPATSALCFKLLLQGARAAGAPEGTVGIVYGQRAGSALVAHPAIKAVGFTGSLGGGGALMKIIAERPDPIPFYGELSSLNPVVITEAAAAERGDSIGAGLVASFTVAAGQLCTKPGLVFLPSGPAGDGVVAAMTAALAGVSEQVLLNERIFTDFGTGTAKLRATPGMAVIHQASATAAAGFHVAAQLVQIDAAELTGDSVDEHFGPVTVIARYYRDGPTGTGPQGAAGIADRDRAQRTRRRRLRRGTQHAAAGPGRPPDLRRLPHRRLGGLGPAPRRTVAVDQQPAHLRGADRDQAIPPPGDLAGCARHTCCRPNFVTTSRTSRDVSTADCCPRSADPPVRRTARHTHLEIRTASS